MTPVVQFKSTRVQYRETHAIMYAWVNATLDVGFMFCIHSIHTQSHPSQV